MIESLTLTVPGIHGQERPRSTASGRHYKSASQLKAEADVLRAYAEALGESRLPGAHADYIRAFAALRGREGKAHELKRLRAACDPVFGAGVPVVLSIAVYSTLPASRPKRVESEPNVYVPDCDNIAKHVQDALNGLMYADDRQIVGLTVMKLPRVRGGIDYTECRFARADR